MRVTRTNGRDAVVVEAPAYEPGNGNLRGGSAGEQLSVRLIDKMTGADVDGAVLTLESSAEHSSPVFRAVVPLPGSTCIGSGPTCMTGPVMSRRRRATPIPTCCPSGKQRRCWRGGGNWLPPYGSASSRRMHTAQVRAVSGDPEATAES